MFEPSKTGRTILRAVDGRQAAGVCTFHVSMSGLEAEISAHLFSGGRATAVLQYGPERDYLCRPPADIAAPVRCGEPGIMAVWVLDDGRPALFGQIVPGAFDRDTARQRLPGSPERGNADEVYVKAAALPVALSLEPEAEPDIELVHEPEPEPMSETETAAPEFRERDIPQPQEIARSQKAPAQPWSPLIVRRAPRAAPRQSVYSPLWDDVSSELEKMLDSLPRTQPFIGGGIGAEFAEVPTGGAVQCYVGSVTINGLKVFMQAVPARPYARPAGFDHSLVSRSGECYWVKYFIQNE